MTTLKVTKTTPLSIIQTVMRNQFEIIMTTTQAKQVRASLSDGVAFISKDVYVSTRTSDDITKATRKSVSHRDLNVTYSVADWNHAVTNLHFGK